MKVFKQLRPIALDGWAIGRKDPFSRVWQLLRALLLDRIAYWGVTITLLVPCLMSFLGGGFSFHGDFGTGLAVTSAYWLYTLVTSIVFGIAVLKALGRDRRTAVKRVQQTCYVVCSFVFFSCLASWYPQVVTATTFGVLVVTAAVALVAEWAIGMCTGPDCEIPQK